VNDVPVANNDTANVNEDSHVTVAVLGNDVLGNNPAVGDQPIVVTAGNGTSGTTSVGVDNQVTYTPSADFHGSDSFSYNVTDGNGDHSSATVGVTVNSVNDIPVAVDDTATVNEDGAINVPVMANDTGLGDGAPFTGTTGEFVLFGPPHHGPVSEPGDNTIRYVPNPNFNGTDTFQYYVVDNDHDRSNTATVTMTVNPGGHRDPGGRPGPRRGRRRPHHRRGHRQPSLRRAGQRLGGGRRRLGDDHRNLERHGHRQR